MRQQGGVGLGRFFLFCGIALGGLAFDLATKTTVFSRIGSPPAPPVALIPRRFETPIPSAKVDTVEFVQTTVANSTAERP